MARVEHSFQSTAPLEDLADRLRERGWKVEERGSGDVEARQGSQITTRLLGGWHVNPAKLPKRLVAERGDRATTVSVEEAMGFGVLDPKLRKKYEAAFVALEQTLAQ